MTDPTAVDETTTDPATDPATGDAATVDAAAQTPDAAPEPAAEPTPDATATTADPGTSDQTASDTAPAEMVRMRYVGDSGVQMPTRGVEAEPGQILVLPSDVATTLGPEFERLETVEVASSGGITVNDFEVAPPDWIEVAKPTAGTVIFRDGHELVWETDGQKLKVHRDYAEQLRSEFPDGFGFDGDDAPAAPEPTVLTDDTADVTTGAAPAKAASRRRRAETA